MAVKKFVEYLTQKAINAEKNDNLERAVELFKKALIYADKKKLKENLLYHLTYDLIALNKLEDALTFAKELHALNSENAEYNYLVALVFEQMFDVENALPYAEKAYSLSPESPSIMRILGHLNLLIGNNNKALKLLEKAYHLTHGEDPTIISDLSLAYAKSGDLEKALELVNQGIEKFSYEFETFFTLKDFFEEIYENEVDSEKLMDTDPVVFQVLYLLEEVSRTYGFKRKELENIERFWQFFYAEKRPRIKNPRAWAGALFYFFVEFNIRVSEIARKFKTPITSLRYAIKKLEDYTETEL